jgi:diadenosine tetraphosphate (Ap4A) HIT family hydrolase/8-oxo-dGTP pyrophosphatase MutT (NUDIX family)
MMNNCLSCQLLQKVEEYRLIYSGQYWQVELHPDQEYLGRSVVVLKRHIESLHELTKKEGAEFFEIVKRFEGSVNKAFKPTHYNWACFMNDRWLPDSPPMHVHWHVLPRYKEARIIDGREFIDSDWPKPAKAASPNKPGNEILRHIWDKIHFSSGQMAKSTERFKLKAAVYVLLRRGEEVLLLQRKNTGYQDGNYGLPAGHMDGEELATSAAARELEEEIGITIDPGDLRLVHTTHRLESGVSSERLELFFELDQWKGDPENMEPEKCDNIAWYPVTQLPPNTIPLVRRVIQLSGKGISFSDYSEEPKG